MQASVVMLEKKIEDITQDDIEWTNLPQIGPSSLRH